MSRTIRRPRAHEVVVIDYFYEYVSVNDRYLRKVDVNGPYQEVRKKALTEYHRENRKIKRWTGPSYFHRDEQRKFRAACRVELRNLKYDPEADYNSRVKPLLPYWD